MLFDSIRRQTEQLFRIREGGNRLPNPIRNQHGERRLPELNGMKQAAKRLETLRPFRKLRSKMNAFHMSRTKPKIDLALAEAVSFLRNAAVSGTLPSCEVILTELCNSDTILTSGFAGMLSRLRQNDREGALRAFTAVAGDREGGDIGRLILQWDELEPEEVLETLLSYQRHLAEVRYTVARRRDELASDLLYVPVVMNVMLVFVNFIFVGYFLDEQEMFQMIF